MATNDKRTGSVGLASLPRSGFVLLILAIAMVGFSRNRNRPTVETTNPSARVEIDQHSGDVVEVVDAGTPPPKETEAPVESSSDEPLADATNSTRNLAKLDGQTQDLLSLVADNTFGFSKREMPAYWSLLARSSAASFDSLCSAANPLTSFHELYSHPSKHRGELCKLDVLIHRVSKHASESGNSLHPSTVYEVWGTTAQSQAWLYVFVTDKLPEGFDESNIIKHRAQIVGYFLKVLAYQPGNASANAKPLAAPVLVGKMEVQSAIKSVRADDSSSLTVFCVLACVAIVVIAYTFLSKRKRGSQRRTVDDADLSWIQNAP